DPPFSRMDLISCRNLLIYLEPDLQRKVLPTLHYALKPEGFLLLGESESVGFLAEMFETVDKKYKVFSKKPGPPIHPYFTVRHPAERPKLPTFKSVGAPEHRDLQGNTNREVDRVTLSRYAPPAVLINGQLQILQFRGET